MSSDKPAGLRKAHMDMGKLLYAFYLGSDEGTIGPASPSPSVHAHCDTREVERETISFKETTSFRRNQDRPEQIGPASRKSVRLARKRGEDTDSGDTIFQVCDQPSFKKRKPTRKASPKLEGPKATSDSRVQLPEEAFDNLLRRPSALQLQRAIHGCRPSPRKRQTKIKLLNTRKMPRIPSTAGSRGAELREYITRSTSKKYLHDGNKEHASVLVDHLHADVLATSQSIVQEQICNDVGPLAASEAPKSPTTTSSMLTDNDANARSGNVIPDTTKSSTLPRKDAFRCGNPHCQTGQTTRGEFDRKVVSHFFGRNKAATKSIPAEAWFQLCRKCYQRDSYAARASSHTFITWSVALIGSNLRRMAQWRPDAKWRVQLWIGAHKRLNEWRKLRLHYRNAQDLRAEAAKVMPPPPVVTQTSNQMSQAYMVKGFPLDHLEDFEKMHEGDRKSFTDLRAVLRWIKDLSAAGQISCLPPFEFLIEWPADDELISKADSHLVDTMALPEETETMVTRETTIEVADTHMQTEHAEVLSTRPRLRFHFTAAGKAYGLLGGSTFGACLGSGTSV